MTRPLYLDDAYRASAPGLVEAVTDEGGIVLAASLFHPTSGGQPGDSGRLVWGDRSLQIATAIKGPDGAIVLVPAEPGALPAPGTAVTQSLDWARRLRHMRMHTALHLLSAVLGHPVTGGQIGEVTSRLDVDTPTVPDPNDLTARLADLVAADLPVTTQWIAEADLDAAPQLPRTLSARPPRGQLPVRLVRIGAAADAVDLQPCGGTHVARTSEIGAVSVGKIEKKGRQTRRIHLHLGTS